MNGVRSALGLTIVIVMAAGFGFLLLQAGTPTANASESAVTPLAWMGGCYPPTMAIGRYFPGDAPCRPSRTISLRQIEMALAVHGVLTAGESLQFAPQAQPRTLACWGLVMNDGQAAGWVCSDNDGLYRTDMGGKLVSARWQLLADGNWTQAES